MSICSPHSHSPLVQVPDLQCLSSLPPRPPHRHGYRPPSPVGARDAGTAHGARPHRASLRVLSAKHQLGVNMDGLKPGNAVWVQLPDHRPSKSLSGAPSAVSEQEQDAEAPACACKASRYTTARCQSHPAPAARHLHSKTQLGTTACLLPTGPGSFSDAPTGSIDGLEKRPSLPLLAHTIHLLRATTGRRGPRGPA
jgi:hypothetical protein